MFRDLRFGVRLLLKQPGFSLIAVLTLALGIGATSAVFGLIQGVLLTPPPYKQPQQLVLLTAARADGQKLVSPRSWPAEQWMEWQKEAKSFNGIAAYAWTFNFLVSNEGSESIEGMVVTRDYFSVMGLQPMLGRIFAETEARPGPAQTIVLGYEFWQRKFNGDPKIIGQIVRISRWDTPPTVIGIMPPGIRFLSSPSNAQEPNYNVNGLVDFWVWPDGGEPPKLEPREGSARRDKWPQDIPAMRHEWWKAIVRASPEIFWDANTRRNRAAQRGRSPRRGESSPRTWRGNSDRSAT